MKTERLILQEKNKGCLLKKDTKEVEGGRWNGTQEENGADTSHSQTVVVIR